MRRTLENVPEMTRAELLEACTTSLQAVILACETGDDALYRVSLANLFDQLAIARWSPELIKEARRT